MARHITIKRHPEAFSKDLTAGRRKRPRAKIDAHCAWIRTLPCLVTGARKQVEAAHIRYGDAIAGKPSTPKGEKPSDCWVVPLCAAEHRLNNDSQHAMSEREYWERAGIDPVQVAQSLFLASGDDERAEVIIREARARAARNRKARSE